MASFDAVAYILELLNEINPTLPMELTEENVVLGTPTAVTDASSSTVNTSITITGVAGNGYIDSIEAYYTRLDVQAYLNTFDAGTLSVDSTIAVDWPTFFTYLNDTYYTAFSEIDYPLTPFLPPSNAATWTVAVNPNSLLFIGSFTVAAANVGEYRLSSVVMNTDIGSIPKPPYDLQFVVYNSTLNGLQPLSVA